LLKILNGWMSWFRQHTPVKRATIVVTKNEKF
jgi:hypothetical protein